MFCVDRLQKKRQIGIKMYNTITLRNARVVNAYDTLYNGLWCTILTKPMGRFPGHEISLQLRMIVNSGLGLNLCLGNLA